MVKTIILEKKYDCEHLLGKFLDNDSYDFVAKEDVDIYKPITFLDEPSESNLLLKFRKNVLPKEAVDLAYQGLRHGTNMTDNRGLAAGTDKDEFQTSPTGHGRRRWVTIRESAALEYMTKGSCPDFNGNDRLKEIWETEDRSPLKGRGNGGLIASGAIWIVDKVKDFNIDGWFESMIDASVEQRRDQAEFILSDKISGTTYGNAVMSGTAGYMDRYPRIPFCRETAWTAANKEYFNMGIPMIEAASKVFKENLPIRWQGQKEEIDKISKEWHIGDSVYTTLTLNKDFRTACHRDAGDLIDQIGDRPRGFSNLTVLSNGKNYDGFYLCFPEYRVAAHIQPGDLIMMDAHQIHGNTPVISCEEGFERVSVVMYFRERMADCGAVAYENMRRDFIYDRKHRHEEYGENSRWNGISPGIWLSDEWKEWQKKHKAS